jgi:hypothetical protein
MSEQAGKQQQTVADALAQRVEARQGPGSPWAEALRELGAVDQAVYQAVARTPTPALGRPFCGLSNAANYSRLWLGIAAVIAYPRPGEDVHVPGCYLHTSSTSRRLRKIVSTWKKSQARSQHLRRVLKRYTHVH